MLDRIGESGPEARNPCFSEQIPESLIMRVMLTGRNLRCRTNRGSRLSVRVLQRVQTDGQRVQTVGQGWVVPADRRAGGGERRPTPSSTTKKFLKRMDLGCPRRRLSWVLMKENPEVRCTNCGKSLDLKIVSCGHCPRVAWRLTDSDKDFLKSLRIASDE